MLYLMMVIVMGGVVEYGCVLGVVCFDDGWFDVELCLLFVFGGFGDGFNLEQLFVVSYVVCFYGVLSLLVVWVGVLIVGVLVFVLIDFCCDLMDGLFMLNVNICVWLLGVECVVVEEFVCNIECFSLYMKMVYEGISYVVVLVLMDDVYEC